MRKSHKVTVNCLEQDFVSVSMTEHLFFFFFPFFLKQKNLGICSPLNGEKIESCSVIDLSSVEHCRLEGDHCKSRKASNMTEVDKTPSKSQVLVHAKA